MTDTNDCYFPADDSLSSFIPAHKEVKHMLYLVAYDISSPKRLRAVARICKDYGLRVEYSVFECDLPSHLFKQMWLELNKVINEDDDAIIAYIICKSCVDRTVVMGKAARTSKSDVFII
jgi:CRISPR-associated protein Cas2